MQENSQKYNNIKRYKIIKNIYKNQGLKGFYRGYVPRLFCIIPMRVLYWGVQNNSNIYLKKNFNLKNSERLILSGTIAGIMQTIIDNPIENIKIKMMTDNKISILSIIKKSKYPGFYITSLRNAGFAICVNVAINYKENINNSNTFLLGAFGGFIGSVLTQPLDYLKTEIQRKKEKKIHQYHL